MKELIEIGQIFISKKDKELLVRIVKVEQDKILWEDCSVKPFITGTFWTLKELFLNSMQMKNEEN